MHSCESHKWQTVWTQTGRKFTMKGFFVMFETCSANVGNRLA